MSSWKAAAFVTLIALPLPLSIAASVYLQRPVLGLGSITIASIRIFVYFFWVLRCVVIPYLFNPYRNLPTPPDVSFLFGHMKQLVKRPNGEYFEHLARTVPNNGLIPLRDIFHQNVVLVVTTPEAAMDILNTKCYDFTKPPKAGKALSKVIGNGLVVAEQDEHKLQRKSVGSAFSGKQIRDLVPVFWSKSLELAQAMADTLSIDESRPSKPLTGTLNMSQWTSRVTLDIIGVACVDRDFGTVHNAEDELAKTYAALFSSSLTNFFAINLVTPDWLLNVLPLKVNQTVNSLVTSLRGLCLKLVEEKERRIAVEGKRTKDILSTLIESEAFGTNQLVDQLLTFLAAGHDTTSDELVWCIYLLCKNPLLQKRLRDELRATISPNTSVDADLIDSMAYLNAVCLETLRLYPAVPSTARQAIRDTTIVGQKVTAGTQISLMPWVINRAERSWGPDAREFNPDRWLGETRSTTGGASKAAFMTFLHGPRSCIGQAFAKLELKCLLAALVLKFNFELQDPSAPATPVGAVTIKPEGGLDVRLTSV